MHSRGYTEIRKIFIVRELAITFVSSFSLTKILKANQKQGLLILIKFKLYMGTS
jgi:hypothetical protein